MSLLSSFIQNQLIAALEAEFVAHSADLQAAFIKEVAALAKTVGVWVEGKIVQNKSGV